MPLSIQFSLEEVRITRNRNTKPTDRNVYMRFQSTAPAPGGMMMGSADQITINLTEAESAEYFIGDVYSVTLDYIETSQEEEMVNSPMSIEEA